MDAFKNPSKRTHGLPLWRVAQPVMLALIVVAAGALWLRQRSPAVDSPRATEQLRRRAPAGMALVPAGDFIAGSDDADADDESRPSRHESIAAYYIDVHEVTNREFHQFDPSHAVPKGEDDLPANSITYDAATAYARWAGKRLPTEAEWEKAARGTDGRRYPWGNAWDPEKVTARRKRPGDRSVAVARPATGKLCAIGPSRLQPIGSKPGGASPYGCMDMAGNAWEWVEGYYNGNPEQRILRGGAVGYGERACRTYVRAIEGAQDT